MDTMKNKLSIVVLFGLALVPSFAAVKDLYVAQSANGSGASCSSAIAASSLPSAWASNVAPGTTIHLCGTIASSIAFQSGGVAGNPVTLKFEPGATMSAPYWTNGITASGLNYIVVDGGTNGSIQATANGSAFANQQNGRAISFSQVSNSEIKNLSFVNLYVHSSLSDSAGGDNYGVFWNGGQNVTFDHNTCHDVRTCFLYAYSGNTASSGINLFGNMIYNVNWGLIIGDGNTNAVLNAPVAIHDNVIHDFVNWDDTANQNHHDGIYCFAVSAGSKLNDCSVYDNYIYGDYGIHSTAAIFESQNTQGTMNCSGVQIFNNVLVNSSAVNFPANGLISDWCTGTMIVNNTLIGSSSTNQYSTAIMINPGVGASIGNNSFSNFNLAIYLANSGIANASNIDYDDYSQVSYVGTDNSGAYYSTLAQWQKCTTHGCPPAGHDAHSSTGNPLLSASFIPQAGSALIGAGGNLTFVGIAALNSDKSGAARPTAGAWDMGAYNAGSVAPIPVPTPVPTPAPWTCSWLIPASVTLNPHSTMLVVIQVVCP